MAGHECYHCKQWVEKGEPHDCWTTTESALTRDLSEDLQDAYQRIREAALELGEQRIYASHHSIMFSRKACHFFVRPKKKHLELCIFLPRTVRSSLVAKSMASSKTKVAHIIKVEHRDQIETPITDWMREAFRLEDAKGATEAAKKSPKDAKEGARKTARTAKATVTGKPRRA